MALDRPVHAPGTADAMTANEAAVVFVYRVKALRGRENNPMSNFVNVLRGRAGTQPERSVPSESRQTRPPARALAWRIHACPATSPPLPDRTFPKATVGGQLCPRLVRLSEVSSGPWARGSLSYGTGRTGNQTE